MPAIKSSITSWNTAAGIFNTASKVAVQFKLGELDYSKIITWNLHSTNLDTIRYDMIIGNDLMKELQIDICYSTNKIKWDSASIPMRDKDISVEDMFITSQELESAATLSDTARLHKILDAKYEKLLAKDVINLNPHLTPEEAQLLESLISKYEFLFDGTLGTWKTKPYDI